VIVMTLLPLIEIAGSYYRAHLDRRSQRDAASQKCVNPLLRFDHSLSQDNLRHDKAPYQIF